MALASNSSSALVSATVTVDPPAELNDHVPLAIEGDEILYIAALGWEEKPRHHEVLIFCINNAKELLEAALPEVDVSVVLSNPLSSEYFAFAKEVELDVIINSEATYPAPVQVGYCQRLALHCSNEGLHPVAQLVAPVHLQLSMSSINLTLRLSGSRYFVRDPVLYTGHLRSLHNQRNITTHLTLLVANCFYLAGISRETMPPDFIGIMATTFVRDRLPRTRHTQLTVGLVWYFLDYLLCCFKGHFANPITLNRMWDKEVVFLSAVAAKGARSVSGDVWEDAILLMKRVKDGLGNPLKLIATVTDMTQQSNEVLMASATLRNLPRVLRIQTSTSSSTSSNGLNKRARETTESDAPEGRESKSKKVSDDKERLVLTTRTRDTASSSPTSSRNGRRGFAPLSGLKNVFALRPPIISPPAITSLFTFVQPVHPLKMMTKLVGGLSFTKDGNPMESSTSTLTTGLVKARIPRNDYIELAVAPKLELSDTAKSQLREEARRARYEEEKAKLEKEKGRSMRDPEVLMWMGRKRSKALYEQLVLEGGNSEQLRLLYPEYN